MNSTGRHQTHQMRGPARRLHVVDQPHERGVLEERPVLDGKVDLPKVHRHHPARADIRVPNLGIAHLAGGQTHIVAVGDERRVRADHHQLVERGRLGQRHRVAGAFDPEAPAIEDAQNDGFRGGHVCLALA